MNANILRGLVAVGALVAATGARAEATDFSAITSAVAFGGVVTAILAIAAIIAVPLVAKKGARMVMSMIGR